MPNRILKESICTSDSIDQLSWFEEAFWYRLIVNCDDYGRMDARLAILKARLFPLKQDITGSDISAALDALAKAGMVMVYESGRKPYVQLLAWERHQQIRAKKSKYPAPDGVCQQAMADDSGCYRNPIQSESESGIECGGGGPNTATRFKTPSVDDVAAYCKERKNQVDAQRFFDYYTANGWRVGKNPMKDWRAAVRTWERNEKGGGEDGAHQQDCPKYGVVL